MNLANLKWLKLLQLVRNIKVLSLECDHCDLGTESVPIVESHKVRKHEANCLKETLEFKLKLLETEISKQRIDLKIKF